MSDVVDPAPDAPDRDVPAAERARGEAWRKAVQNAGGIERSTPAARHMLLHQAEMAVLRRLVFERLPGGEVEYWQRVIEELSKP